MVVDLIRPRATLEAEIRTLRQQINILRLTAPKKLSFIAIDGDGIRDSHGVSTKKTHTGLAEQKLYCIVCISASVAPTSETTEEKGENDFVGCPCVRIATICSGREVSSPQKPTRDNALRRSTSVLAGAVKEINSELNERATNDDFFS
jgi:hypothetical protein